jgi:L-fucose isomerase-like protein
MDGGIAVCKIAKVRELMSVITGNGFEHHVAMVRGSCESILSEVAGKYLGWELYVHN